MEDTNETRDFIKRQARHGDFSTVAAMVGLKADTVRRIVRGTRKNDAVLSIFSAYLCKRAKLERDILEEAAK